MTHVKDGWARLQRFGSNHLRLMRSAEEAGLSPAEMKAALDAEPAAFSHHLAEGWQVCDFILTQIAETLRSGEKAQIFHARFDLRSAQHAKAVRGMSSEQLIEWLKANQYWPAVYELTFKLICRALALDFLEFVGEAVRMTIRGPLTVAIALLRKPLKENLFYLEWILADPEDFFKRFYGGDVGGLAISKLDETRKLEIIRGAMAKSACGDWVEPEFVYELRFAKQSAISLEPSWQKANHLITTMGVLKTERENFNFIFSTPDARDTQWRGFYATVPILLFHALQMIETMIAQFAKRDESGKDLVPLRTLAAMLLWMKSEGCVLDLTDVERRFASVVGSVIRSIRCPACNKRCSTRRTNFRTLFENSALTCFGCGETVHLNPSAA